MLWKEEEYLFLSPTAPHRSLGNYNFKYYALNVTFLTWAVKVNYWQAINQPEYWASGRVASQIVLFYCYWSIYGAITHARTSFFLSHYVSSLDNQTITICFQIIWIHNARWLRLCNSEACCLFVRFQDIQLWFIFSFRFPNKNFYDVQAFL